MDPYAHAIKPMLAESMREPFDSPDHVFEVKWDGTRAIAFVRGGTHRFQNRRFNDITARYPELHVGTRKDAILDGEVVILADGIPSFEKLQEREHTSDRIRIDYLAKRIPATYVVFDVLYVEKEDVTSRPLERRKGLLRDLVIEGGNLAISETIDARGVDFFRAVVDRGLEGIIAKRKGSRYHMGRRTRDWIKIKKSINLDCVVCGITQGGGERASTFGALVLGAYRGEELTYVGRVGTGFDEATRREIHERLRPFATDACPFREVPEMEDPVVFWARPGLVCEVRFLEWSKEGHMRAPAFGRVRLDKEPRDCVLT